MEALLVRMVPLAVGAAVSPTMLAASLLILSSKEHPRSRAVAYLAGAASTVALVGAIAVAAGGAAHTGSPHGPSSVSAGVDVLLGVLLVVVGVRRLVKQPRESKTISGDKPGTTGRLLAAGAGLGVLLTATNFTSLVFFLAAAKEVADSNLDAAAQALAMSIVGFGFVLPITLPLAVTILLPTASVRILDILNTSMRKYGGYAMPVIAVIFGAYLLYKGLRFIV